MADFFGIQEVFARGWFFDSMAENVCTIELFRSLICANTLFLLNGYNPWQFNYVSDEYEFFHLPRPNKQ